MKPDSDPENSSHVDSSELSTKSSLVDDEREDCEACEAKSDLQSARFRRNN
jgi:hypothetical protein